MITFSLTHVVVKKLWKTKKPETRTAHISELFLTNISLQ
tara:strand:- start:927 stop:1043 length:117 start_codon:yes stop_codon:yes gene_type:complete